MSMTLEMIPTTDARIDVLRLQQTQEEAKAVFDAIRAEAWEDIFDTYKAWQGIHFLLTGTAWEGEAPLGYLMGGLAIGTPSKEEGSEDDEYPKYDDFWVYGPPRALYSHEVKAWADALEPLTEETLRARFDPTAFQAADLYAVSGDSPEAALDWLMPFYLSFRGFVQQTAETGDGLLMYM